MLSPIQARDPDQAHRNSTPLELFYDLATVVAIAAASTGLHHRIAEGEVVTGVVRYMIIFFTIWWSWMNFTWFSSAYDTPDTSYVVSVFALIFGTCFLASGITHFYETGVNLTGVIGWTLQRGALVFLWARAAAGGSRPALYYTIGLTLLQCGWVLNLLLLPQELQPWGAAALLAMELGLPAVAGQFSWHREHMVERYGLLTLIVLGEGITSIAEILGFPSGQEGAGAAKILIAISATLIVSGMWWLYFRHNEEAHVVRNNSLYVWAYVHGVTFASAAAVGAGLAVWADWGDSDEAVSTLVATTSVAVPAAIYLLSLVAVLHLTNVKRVAILLCAAIILVTTYLLPNLGFISSALMLLVIWFQRQKTTRITSKAT